MTATISPTAAKTSSNPLFLSEIFPLQITKLNLLRFRITPKVERENGNRLSWRLSQKFPEIVFIWYKREGEKEGDFWGLAKSDGTIPGVPELKERLTQIQTELRQELGDIYSSFKSVRDLERTSGIEAELAVRVLKIIRPFACPPVWSDQGVEVRREINFWSETIELNKSLRPALALTSGSNFLFKENLAHFYENHPYRNDAEKLLSQLKVRDIDKGSFGTIIRIEGTVGERREELLQWKPASISEKAIKEAPDEQPVVVVKFGKDSKEFHYAMAALRPCVTPDTAARFAVDYGDLLKQTKITYEERKKLLRSAKEQATKALADYGFQLDRSVNSRQYPELFLLLSQKLEDTQLLFGKGVTSTQNKILAGLSRGGVYRRHQDYDSAPIRLAALKLCDNIRLTPLLQEIQQRLKKYGFDSNIAPEHMKAVSLANLTGVDARAKVERAIDELMTIPVDLVLIFLPTSDRQADDTKGDSLYSWIYSRLLRREIASQVIYEDTVRKVKPQYLLNQVIPGILAKLGNLPFVLAQPIKIADYFVGLDISRAGKKKAVGSINACASVRLYGKQGEFISYRLEDALIEGEEIPQLILERFLPQNKLKNKTVLIYRDGGFCGDEVKHLQARAKAIGSQFILVECRKSGIPRLYNSRNQKIQAPTQGLALRLSSHEVIIITTQITEKVGSPQPLRLKVIPNEQQQVSMESLIQATLLLTLLHHGSLKPPRLPIPLFASDRMAYRRLQGICPGSLEGDRQFWL